MSNAMFVRFNRNRKTFHQFGVDSIWKYGDISNGVSSLFSCSLQQASFFRDAMSFKSIFLSKKHKHTKEQQRVRSRSPTRKKKCHSLNYKRSKSMRHIYKRLIHTKITNSEHFFIRFDWNWNSTHIVMWILWIAIHTESQRYCLALLHGWLPLFRSRQKNR